MLSCGQTSAKVDILSRFTKFFTSLRNSASHKVQVLSRYLARDVQSATGKNLRLVQETTGIDPWTTGQGRLRSALVAAEVVGVPTMNRWCLPYLCSLLAQRRKAHKLVLEDEETRLDELIESLVIN